MPWSLLSSKRPAEWGLRPLLASVPKPGTCRIHLGFHVGQTRAVQSFHQVLLDPYGYRCKALDRTKGEGGKKGRAEAPAPAGDWHLRLWSSAQQRRGARSHPPRSKLGIAVKWRKASAEVPKKWGLGGERGLPALYMSAEGWTKANNVYGAREREACDGAARHLQMCLGLRLRNCTNAPHGDKM